MALTTKTNGATSRWILRQGAARTDAPRLFCFPHAGSGASVYAAWAKTLGSAVEVLSVQLPGRENRLHEQPLARIGDLVEEIVSAGLPYLDAPFAFFGHSMGALVAFECARVLRRRGHVLPYRLFVSARRPPHLPADMAPLGTVPDEALLTGLQERYGLTFAPGMRPLIELMMPTIRADILAVDNYVYAAEAPFEFPILAFGGAEDRSVPLEDLLEWRTHTRDRFELHIISGSHFFVKAAPAALLDRLRNELTSGARRANG